MALVLDLDKNPYIRRAKEGKDLKRRRMSHKSSVISQRKLYSGGCENFVRSMDTRELIASSSRNGLRKRRKVII